MTGRLASGGQEVRWEGGAVPVRGLLSLGYRFSLKGGR